MAEAPLPGSHDGPLERSPDGPPALEYPSEKSADATRPHDNNVRTAPEDPEAPPADATRFGSVRRKLTPMAADGGQRAFSSPGALGDMPLEEDIEEEEEDEEDEEDLRVADVSPTEAVTAAAVAHAPGAAAAATAVAAPHACVSRFGACAANAAARHAEQRERSDEPLEERAAAGSAGTAPVSLTQILSADEDYEQRLLLEEYLLQQQRYLMGNAPALAPAPSHGQGPPGHSAGGGGGGGGGGAQEVAAWAAAAAARAEAERLREVLRERDAQLLRLQREVHKLRSVLQQATSFAAPAPATTPASAPAGGKRQGVSGESSEAAAAEDTPVQRFDKDFRSKQLIKDALMDNDFLKNLDGSQVREMVDSMFPREFAKGAYVIHEGEAGSHLFVSAEGELEVLRGGRSLGRFGPGKAFGELAILYNCTRTASVLAVTGARVWALDRRVFQRVMVRQGLRRMQDNLNFLRSVPLLRGLSPPLLARLADALQLEFFPAGTHVVREGAPGDTFYIISGGGVRVTKRSPGSSHEETLRTLNRGDYFGEQALLKEEVRTASVVALPPGVECLALDRESFAQLIGDLSELRERNYGDGPRSPAHAAAAAAAPASPTSPAALVPPTAEEDPHEKELSFLRLDDLEAVATLGVGGFGRVELVQHALQRGRTFALKCLKKQHIVDTQQQEHVYNERAIMLSCRSPFICRLYRSFRDAKFVYLLLEACLGGEVWTVLRDRGHFDDVTARFVTGCVVEALDYLHARGVIYRDLKPENLLLDHRGYVKLVDFGFAKRLAPSGKTWTFCGTPEYVAPEVILNKGHDRSVDFWALGVLVFELLTGAPPFSAQDPMQTYNLILRGVEATAFPRHVGRAPQALVRRLCRDAPAERLGAQRGGLADVRKHKWFQGFDWDGLRRQTLAPPFTPQIRGPTDTSNFDSYPRDHEIPPDEFSNWDIDF